MPEDAHDDYLDGFLSSAFASAIPGQESDDIDPARFLAEEDDSLPTQVGASHRVIERVGSGGVGTVYRVEDESLGRDVAIKVLRKRFLSDSATVARFGAEARLCAQLTHPGIVSVHEVGKLEDGRPYFTMRLIEGETFAVRIRTAHKTAEDSGARTGLFSDFTALCQTLAYVHEQGIVHGDLKPQNVMVGPFGEVQVMDWGFAHRVHTDAAEGTDAEHPRRGGTPAYMAPEQASGSSSRISLRTDVFGLGAVLCEILTGAPPYRSKHDAEALLHAKHGVLDELTDRLGNPDLPADWARLALSCLAASPDARPADASVVAAQIQTFSIARERDRRRLELEAAEARARAVQARRERKLTLALAGSIILGLAAVGYAWLWAQQEGHARQAQAARTVARALRTASVVEQRARTEVVAPTRAWSEVIAAAARLRAAADDRALDDATREHALAEAARATSVAANETRRIALEQQLTDLRPHFGQVGAATELDTRYREAFLAAGIDWSEAPEDVAGAVAESPLREALIDALDRWAQFRRRVGVPSRESWREVHDVATRVDSDPWRSRLRTAFGSGDRSTLLRLANEFRSEEAEPRSPATVDLLAQSLIHVGQRQAAIDLYRNAVLRFPNDHELIHSLAVLLEGTTPAPREEITRLAWSLVSLRPHDDHALTDLGRELALKGDNEDALEILDRAIGIRDTTRARLVRGNVYVRLARYDDALTDFDALEESGHALGSELRAGLLTRLARLDQAVESFRRAAHRQPESANAAMQLGRVLAKRGRAGDPEDAIASLQRAIELDPDLAEAHCNLGESLRWLGRFDEAADATRRGHRLGSARQQWPYPSDDWVVVGDAFAQAAEDYDAWRPEELPSDTNSLTRFVEQSTLVPEIFGTVALRRRDDALAWRLFVHARDLILEDPTRTVLPPQRVWFETALAGIRECLADEPATTAIANRDLEILFDALQRWIDSELDRADITASISPENPERGSAELLRFRYNPDLRRLGSLIEKTAFGERELEDGTDLATAWRTSPPTSTASSELCHEQPLHRPRDGGSRLGFAPRPNRPR